MEVAAINQLKLLRCKASILPINNGPIAAGSVRGLMAKIQGFMASSRYLENEIDI
ncbi:hypothetical protein SPWS13_0778 [Shewanella putrefaciens]|nr:hypothetical protein SPWS13_0778 [Shewanella putrefaciens]